MYSQKQLVIVEQILMRAAEEIGDITGPVISLYYERFPGARDQFEHHKRGDIGQLEGEMVERALYCLMTWFESPGEVEILLSGSVLHHNDTLKVAPEYYGGLINATADVLEGVICRENATEVTTWRELRNELRQIVDNSC